MVPNSILIPLYEMPLVLHLEKLRPLPIIARGSFMICHGFALTQLLRSILWLLLTVIIWTFGEMLTLSFSAAFVANRAQEGRRGDALGLCSFIFASIGIFSPLIGGWIYEKCGSNAIRTAIGLFGVGLFFGFHLLQFSLAAQGKRCVENSTLP